MSYRIFASMNIAVIGSGVTAEAYALAFACAGHEVFMALKNGDTKRVSPGIAALQHINLCSIESAAAIADMVIIATPAWDVREVAYWLGDVRGKVIVDATANVFSTDDCQVSTVSAIKAITGSQHVIKVFNTRGYDKLLHPLFGGQKPELLLVSDSKKAKELTRIMATEIGITNCYDFGDGSSLPLFNAMTQCWRSLLITQYNAPELVTG